MVMIKATLHNNLDQNYVSLKCFGGESNTPNQDNPDTYLFLLLVEVINYNANKEIQSEEWAKDDKDYKV